MTPMVDPTHVRRLFLEPAPAYAVGEAAELLGMQSREVREWIESGELEPMGTSEGVRVPWGELVSFAMTHWDQEEIERALGAELEQAIPELLRLADLHVRIPRLEIAVLESLAKHDGGSVDAVLARELLDLVSAHSDWLSQEIPGFTNVLIWPANG